MKSRCAQRRERRGQAASDGGSGCCLIPWRSALLLVLTAFAAAVSWGPAVAAAGRAQPDRDDTPRFRYGATVDADAFAYRRDIAAPPDAVVELQLDAAALAHCAPGFADVRIVTAEGRQVPYLLRRQDEPLAMRLALEKDQGDGARAARNPNAHVSRYIVRLPYSHLPSAQLVLRTTARVFSREVRLEAPDPNQRVEQRPNVLCSLLWSHTDPDTDAPGLTFDVASLDTAAVHLVVDEGDNAPLPLDRPTLLLPSYRLRFARPPGVGMQLVYGNRQLEAPRYDVALVPQSLLEAPSAPASVAPEPRLHALHLPPGTVFWAALVAAVIILAALIARLLRTG